MKKIGLLLVLVSLTVMLVGCATPFPYGMLYTEVKAPVAAAGEYL